MKEKPRIEKINDSRPCYICKGKDENCRACSGTGIFNEYHYRFTANGMCFESDNLA